MYERERKKGEDAANRLKGDRSTLYTGDGSRIYYLLTGRADLSAGRLYERRGEDSNLRGRLG